jgi:hypothetical protein
MQHHTRQTPISVVLLALLVAAAGCATPPPAATATPTVPTSTLPPPTLAPTATLTTTPTEIPDPNMPKDASKLVNGIYYKDVVEKGTTVTYEWVPIVFEGDPREVKGHWFTSHGSTPLMVRGGELPDTDTIPLTFDVEERLSAPYIRFAYDKSQFGPHVLGGRLW